MSGGEDMRGMSGREDMRGMPLSWLAINDNKRSLTLDLQHPDAKEIVRRLTAKADVVMANLRGGVTDRLGLGYKALSAICDRLAWSDGIARSAFQRALRHARQKTRRRRQDGIVKIIVRIVQLAPALS